MVWETLEQAIRAIQSGNKQEGNRLIRIVIQSTGLTGPTRAIAFLWLAEITDDPAEKQLFLREALAADPTNLDILQRLNAFLLAQKLPLVPPPPETLPDFSPRLPLGVEPSLIDVQTEPSFWAGAYEAVGAAGYYTETEAAMTQNGAPPTASLHEPEAIEFTHFYPSIVEVGAEVPLYVYVHLASVIDAVVADFDERKEFAAPSLAASETPDLQFKRGTLFTIVPQITGAHSIPDRADVSWEDDFECVRFTIKMRTHPHPPLSLTGTVSVYLGSVILAQLPLVANIARSGYRHPIITKRESRFRFKRLFLSYSHRDIIVIKAIDHIYQKYPEIETYIDYKFLRASDYWWPEIQHKIEQAEALQLFWSIDSAKSPNVANEWHYALALPRPIVPIMLRPEPPTPAPAIPPELQHIHFEDFDHFIERL